MAVRLVVLGRQGAGKGTQCARLHEHYGAPHISTGDMLRAAAVEGTEFGLKAKDFMDRGELLPDEIMIGVVKERLAQDDVAEHGYLLDGFPRTVGQATALDDILGGDMGLALNIDVPLDEVKQRIRGRGRDDDSDEAVERRLALYEQETAPLIQWFTERDMMLNVDGIGTEDEIAARLIDVIDAHT